jgi:hypothetical protein
VTRTRLFARAVPGATFFGSAVRGDECVVALGAVGVAGVGVLGLVTFLVPGSVCARVVVMPA